MPRDLVTKFPLLSWLCRYSHILSTSEGLAIVDGPHPVVKLSPRFPAKLFGSPCDGIELFPTSDNSSRRTWALIINQMCYLLPSYFNIISPQWLVYSAAYLLVVSQRFSHANISLFLRELFFFVW